MLTSSELTAMQTQAVASMLDACKVQTPSDVEGDFGQEGTTYSDGTEIACGFEAGSAQRGSTIAGVDVELNARIRVSLAAGVSITPNHRIKLTKRLGTTLGTAEVYQVLGWPKRGPTCYVVEVRRVS